MRTESRARREIRRRAGSALLVAGLVLLGPACASTRYGSFQITSEPEGAYVSDATTGKSYGETPTKAWWFGPLVGCASVEVRLEKRGFEPVRRPLQVCPRGNRDVAVANPEQLHVILTPLVPVAGAPPQQQQQQQTVVLGSPTGPQDRFGSIAVSSVPDGADVYVDGSFVGSAPVNLKLREGIYLVEVRKQGFSSFDRKIRVLGDSQVHLRAELAAR